MASPFCDGPASFQLTEKDMQSISVDSVHVSPSPPPPRAPPQRLWRLLFPGLSDSQITDVWRPNRCVSILVAQVGGQEVPVDSKVAELSIMQEKLEGEPADAPPGQ